LVTVHQSYAATWTRACVVLDLVSLRLPKTVQRAATHLAFSASLPRPFRPPLPRPQRAQMWRPALPPATRGDSLPLPLLQLRRTRIPRPSPAAAVRADLRRRAGDNDDAWGVGRPGAEAPSTVRPYLHLRRYQVPTVDDAQVPRGEQEWRTAVSPRCSSFLCLFSNFALPL